MEKQDKFDEFGNLLESESSMSQEQEEIQEEFQITEEKQDQGQQYLKENIDGNFPLQHDEKQYYPDLDTVYKNAEYKIQEEDTQDIKIPIIKPPEKQKYYFEYQYEDKIHPDSFLKDLLSNELNYRNVAIVGNYHSGKTKFLDLLIKQQNYFKIKNCKKNLTDSLQIEKQQKMTIISKPILLMLQDIKGKHYGFTFIDTPGHPDFHDEIISILNIVDSVIIVIDVIEGITNYLLEIFKVIKYYELDVIFVLNKIDRYIVEMRLPPKDAYLSLKLLVDQIQIHYDVCPTKGNILFSSCRYNFLFSLKNFANLTFPDILRNQIKNMQDFLWGDIFYDSKTCEFVKENKESKNTFVQFVLEPIYKIFSHCLAKENQELNNFLQNFNIKITKQMSQNLELKYILRYVFSKILLKINSFITFLVKNTPNPLQSNERILKKLFQQNLIQIESTENQNQIIILISKFYPVISLRGDIPIQFNALGRVLKGTLEEQTQLYLEDQNEKKMIQIKNISLIKIEENKINVKKAYQGNIVCIQNIGTNFNQSAILHNFENDLQYKLKSLQSGSKVKLGIEPIRPSQLNNLHVGLRSLNLFFSGIKIKIEDSGEILILGRGEMIMNLSMDLLRNLFTDIEIRISEPCCTFAETIQQTSQIFATVKSLNKKNSFQFLSENIDKDIKNNYINILEQSQDSQKDYLRQNHQMDLFTIKSIWSFYPNQDHPNLLINEVFNSKEEKLLLDSKKQQIVNGFSWALQKGPLCEEPIHNCTFKIINANISQDNLLSSPGQIIPTVQRGIHCALLLGSPRLLEPNYQFEILCSSECLPTVYTILSRRRGQLLVEQTKPGTFFYELKGKIPILDSFGFEVDLRTQTLGQAQVNMFFDNWSIVPGDPLDKNKYTPVLEPANANALARDIFMKTRRRKGLNEDIALIKYFDDENILKNIKKSLIDQLIKINYKKQQIYKVILNEKKFKSIINLLRF